MLNNIFFNDILSLKQKRLMFFLLIIIIIFTKGFEYVNWNPTIGGWINSIIYIGLIGYLIINNTKGNDYHFRSIAFLMMLLPFISICNSYSLFNQSPIEGIKATMKNSIWVLYFLLHKYKVKESTLLRCLFIISLIIFFIQIIQQFSYPNALFGVMDESTMAEKGLVESAEMRNGLWRFRMNINGYFTMPILLVLWLFLRKKWNIIVGLILLFFIVSIYLSLTRQVIFSCVFTLFISFFIGVKRINYKLLIGGFLFILLLYSFYDILFESLAEKTKEESSEDNVRILAATFFWNDSLRTPFTFLFGMGNPSGSGAFMNYNSLLTQKLKFYISDVGFIGMIWQYGVIYVLLSYYLLYKLYFKYKRLIPTYIRLFVVFVIPMSPMIFPFAAFPTYIVWIFLLYISDLHINHSSLVLKTTKIEFNNI